jgi:hypothetical protein
LFVACSGAETKNIGLLDTGNKAQHPRSPQGTAGGQTQAVNARDFAQLRGRPDLVTIGIGGNDAGFAGAIAYCVGVAIAAPGQVCTNAPGFKEAMRSKIDGDVYDRLVTTFSRLRNVEFPTTTILAYGYPTVLDPAADCAGIPVGFTGSVKQWFQSEYLPALNQAVADAAATVGITYMPIDSVTAGHEICKPGEMMNGYRWPLSESFHPNQRAHDAIARFFMSHYTVGGRLTFTNPQPNPTIRTPGGPALINVVTLRAAPQGNCGAQCLVPTCTPSSCGLDVHLRGAAPNMRLKVVAHSQPIVLGEIATDETGDGDVTLTVPATVPDGDHLVEVTGTSPDGVTQAGFAPIAIQRTAFVEPVSLDIRPGDPTAAVVNLKSNGVLPMAVLSTGTFDAHRIDPTSACFGPSADPRGSGNCTEKHGRGHLEDVNGDGRVDLVLHFDVRSSGLTPSDTTACVDAKTVEGATVRGCDTIVVRR